jgi:hypothetical protein
MKDYLNFENQRNVAGHRVFIRFLNRAFGPESRVLVAHHIVCMPKGQPPVEIPSADTMWFDRELMTKVFGDDVDVIMPTLMAREGIERELAVAFFLDALDAKDPDKATAFPEKEGA